MFPFSFFYFFFSFRTFVNYSLNRCGVLQRRSRALLKFTVHGEISYARVSLVELAATGLPKIRNSVPSANSLGYK